MLGPFDAAVCPICNPIDTEGMGGMSHVRITLRVIVVPGIHCVNMFSLLHPSTTTVNDLSRASVR